jgi:hypothetical protein
MNSPTTTPISAKEMDGVSDAKVQASVVVHVEGHAGHRRDLSRARGEGLREIPDGDADARHYLYLACAFLTKDMSTACLKGMGFSRASGTHTFIPRS